MEPSVYIRELLAENEPERLQGVIMTLVRDEIVQAKIITLLTVLVVTEPCLLHNLDHVEEFASLCATMLALGFESGKRAGRSELMEEIGMPK